MTDNVTIDNNKETNSQAEGRLFVDVHLLQVLPPNCANRDDKGSPKSACYGGVTRSRISSQSIKAAVRRQFATEFGEGWVGKRTKYAAKLVAKEIAAIAPDMDAEEEAQKVFTHVGKNEEDKTAALFFISPVQAKAVARLIVDGSSDKGAFNKALNENPAIDMALFGRMAASNPVLNYDACAQVAHAVSTHEARNEYDYFSAVDDCDKGSGAAHLDTAEFTSSTMYRYANINVHEARKYLGEMTAKAVAGFIASFIYANPSGKEHSFAHCTLPYMVYVAFRTDRAINFADAFEKPVSNKDGGYAENSERVFCNYIRKTYRNYGNAPAKAFGFGDFITEFAEESSLPELLNKVEDWINTNM